MPVRSTLQEILNCPGFQETQLVEYPSRDLGGRGTVKLLLVFRWRNITERGEEAEPGHPGQRGELDVLQTAPGAIAINHFRFEQSDDGFGQRIVVGIAAATDGWLDPASAKCSVYRIERYWAPRSLSR